MILSKENLSSINIPSVPQLSRLSVSKPTIIEILPDLPKPELHPHIVEACKAIYGKPPDQLTEEECEHFRGYRQWKINNGVPIEEDFLYKPR